VYAKARVLHVYKKDSKKRYFILVAGPWATKAKADAFMQSSPVLAKGWLRSAKSLKAQFTKP
jgi:septal ring-binding cell division protein DamX